MDQSMSSRPRPLSPHLSVYRWQIQMVTSILHRATDIALAFGTILVVVALLALARRRHAANTGATKLPPIVPLFIAGIVAAMLVRTTGVLPTALLYIVAVIQKLLLSAAMFALGLGVHVRSMLKVGGKPFVLAAAATAVIASIGLAGALLLGQG